MTPKNTFLNPMSSFEFNSLGPELVVQLIAKNVPILKPLFWDLLFS